MADNFLQFSLLVPLKTKAELRWCAKTLAALTRLFDNGEVDKKRTRAIGPLGRRVINERWEYLDFQFSIEPTRDDAEGICALWIYAEEAGEPEHFAAVLEAFLKKFRPTGILTFSWATTCSKMRVGEFSGGAAVVTGDGTKFMDAQSWAEDLAARFTSISSGAAP